MSPFFIGISILKRFYSLPFNTFPLGTVQAVRLRKGPNQKKKEEKRTKGVYHLSLQPRSNESLQGYRHLPPNALSIVMWPLWLSRKAGKQSLYHE